MARGERADGRDAVAAPVAGGDAWPDLRLVVAVTSEAAKATGSTEAMELTARTSPYYAAWIASVAGDLADARASVAAPGRARRMHASALAAEPGILYWTAATVAAIETVMALRARDVAAYFTIDAGPHVKVLCDVADAPTVGDALLGTAGVLRTVVAAPGRGAHVVEAA